MILDSICGINEKRVPIRSVGGTRSAANCCFSLSESASGRCSASAIADFGISSFRSVYIEAVLALDPAGKFQLFDESESFIEQSMKFGIARSSSVSTFRLTDVDYCIARKM